MGRKTGRTLSDSREQISRRYKRGSLVNRAVKGDANMSEQELAWRKETACLLIAAGFSESYAAEALGTTKGVVNGWFKNDERMHARVIQVKDEITTGALKLMRGYLLEAVEMLMSIARSTDDEALAVRVLQDFLDRGGISKVNKSESLSSAEIKKTTEVELTDKSGLADALKDAPPEVQMRIAEQMDEILALASEHTERDVTHGHS